MKGCFRPYGPEHAHKLIQIEKQRALYCVADSLLIYQGQMLWCTFQGAIIVATSPA